MHTTTSRMRQATCANRHSLAGRESTRLRYKHLAFGVGLALGSWLVCGVAMAGAGVAATASPTGGQVVGGVGTITQQGASTIVAQQSKMLSLNWQTFNVGKDASVLFKQPGVSAVALNRILDQNPSQIFGKINSNGQVFLINTHGIIFGSSAQLNVGGLVASTLDLTPNDFLAQHFNLDAHGGSAGVVNHGTIAAASGGSVSLIGGQVQNDGVIVADYGHINLDGADQAVLNFDGDGLINVQITGALKQRLDADQAAVVNNGTLRADSGTVVLQASAAKNLFTTLVNNSGVIEAGGISTAGGEVRLVGSGGDTTNSGSIDVSGTQGGSVQVLSDQNVGMSGSITADAVQNGDGGNILVKGGDSADISGTLAARGGAQGGNGGFIETSGEHVHFGDTTRVDTLAPFGQAGTWLIDPQDFVIGSTASSDISGATLSTNLGTGNVNILSSDGTLNAAGNGDIIILDPVSWSANHTLTLKAARNIEINSAVTASGSASLTLEPASAGTTDPQNTAGTLLIDSGGSLSMSGSGAFTLPSTITNNGALSFALGGNFSYAGVISGTGTLSQSGNKTLTLTGANLYTGATDIGGGSTLALTTGSIADSGGVQADGTFDISGTTGGASIKSLSGAGVVVLGNETLTLTAAASNFAGAIGGNGGLALTGGIEILSGTSNTYKGGTTISNGTLQVAGDSSLGNSAGDVTINSNGTLQAGADFNSARTIHIANTANIDTNGHAVTLSGNITSGDATQGSFDKMGAGTLTLTGTGNLYKYTNVNAGTLALKNGGVLGGLFFSVASGATFDISQITASGVSVDSLNGAGEVDLGGKTLTIGSGNTPWVFSGVLADGGIGSGTGGSLVMDDPGVTGVLSGASTYTGTTTITGGTLSVSSDANLGNGGNLILDGGTLENTASFTLNHTLSTGTNGGTLQNDTGTDLTVANAITGTGSLTQNGPGTLTLNGDVTTTGATQVYNGAVALGNDINFTGTTVTLNGVTGNSHNLTVTGNAALDGVLTGVINLLVSGTTALGTTGVTTTGTQGYGGTLTLSGGNTALQGTTVTVNGVTGNNNNLTVTGNAALDGALAGVGNLLVSGTTALGTTNVTTAGTQEYDGTLTLNGGNTTLQGTTVTVNGVTGNSNNLTVTGNAALDGTLASVGNLLVTGTTALGTTGVTTTGTQEYDGTLTLNGGNTTLQGTTVTVNGVTGNSNSLAVTGNAALDGVLTGVSNLLVSGTTALGTTGVTTTGTQQYDGTLTLNGGNTTLQGTTVTLNGVTGNNNNLTVTGNAALNGAIANVDALSVTGTTTLGTGSLTTTGTQTYAGAVTLSGDTVLTSTGGDVAFGSTVDSATTTARSLTVDAASGQAGFAGAVGATNALNNLDISSQTFSATGTIKTTGNLSITTGGAIGQSAAWTVGGNASFDAGANAINLGSANNFAGNVALINSGNNAVTVNNGSSALTLGSVTVGTGALTLSGTGITQAAGTSITQAAGAAAATFNAGVGMLALGNAGNDLTGMVNLTNSGANDVLLDNGGNALKLGNVSVGTGKLDISGTGISQVAGTGIVQAPGAGTAAFDARAGALNLNSTLNDLTGTVSLANSGNNQVYLDNGGNALSLGALNVGSGPLTITDYGVGALLLTQNVTTSGGAVNFGGAVTIDGSPTVSIDTTGGGAAGANISFGGNVNAAAPNADSLTLTAGTGAVNFGGAVGNTAELANLTTNSKTFSAASTLGIGGGLSITTTGGPISQGGAWSVGGTSNFNAGSNAITLANASNSFGGLITATGGAVEIGGTGTLDMGAVTATSLKLDGASLLHDDITTTGAQTYNGAVTLDGSGNGNSVALDGNGITFVSTVDNASSTNPQALTVGSGTGAAQFGGAVGGLNGPLGALAVNGTGQAQFFGNVAAASLTATAPVLLDANVTTSGNQTYNGAVVLGTNVAVSSSNGDVSFGSTVDNAVAGTPESLTATAANGQVKFGNAVGTLDGPLGNLTTSSATFSAAGVLNIGGDLSVTTTAGAIGQNAAWKVVGNSVFNAGNNAVALANPGNDFTGTVTVTGAGVSVRDVNDLTIGGLTDNNAGDVSLIAGGQLNGVGPINAGTGSITLAASGAVLTTAALTGGDITLTGGNGISVGDNVNAGGTLTLNSNGGNISEAPTAVITAGTLTGSSSGSTHLDGNNQIAVLGNFTANGFSLTNAQALTVGSGITIDGGAGGTALTTTAGDLTINGAVGNAGGTTALNSAGAINEGAGGVVSAAVLTGQSAGDTTLTGANKIASVGLFKAVNFTLVDNAALSVVGPLVTTGDISLTTTGSPANVLNVGQTLTGGSITLSSAGDLSVRQTVQGAAVALAANGNLAIDAAVNSGTGATTLTQSGAGSISEGTEGSITAGTLTGVAQGGVNLDGANAVASLGTFSANGFALNNAAVLTVATGAVVNGGSSTRLTTTGAGSNLTLDGSVAGVTTTLISAGALNEGANGSIQAGTLTGSAVNGAQLTGTNAIANLGNFSAQGLALTNGQSLTIANGATVDGGASTTLTTTGAGGNLAIDGNLKGATTTLLAAGAVSEGSNGSLQAGTLAGSSVGSTTLASGHNNVANLGNYTADGFNLATVSGLTVVAGNTVDGGSSTTLTTAGTGHDLTVDGRVHGTLTKLASGGAISEGAAGGITAGTLTGSSVGDTTLDGANQIASLGAFSARNFYLTDAHALTVGGPLATTGGAGNISLVTTGGSGNTLTVNQAVHGAAITMTSAGDLSVANAIVGTEIGLTANGSLAIDAAVDSGSGVVTLTQAGTGGILGGANGGITAGTLTGTSTGATSLGSASQFMDNHVGVLGGFVAPAGFSFTNGQTLTLASVNGSAFTVNAGQSPVYLAVQNGDLLQTGNNWLYDSVGTWASTGHIGLASAPIYVMGVSNQAVASIGLPPAYFYAVDMQGNLLPLTGGNSVNVPTSILSSNSQGVSGHSDHYIDISVITANYRSYGVVQPGVLLPPDQLECAADQSSASAQCPENN